jgi:hypothetical protein
MNLMKTPYLITKALLVSAITLITTLTAPAAVLTADNPDSATNDTSITVGTGGITGYFFAATVPTAGGSQADLSSLPNFAVSVTSPYVGVNLGNSGSTITVDGTSYHTGVDYTSSGNSTYQTVATIALTSDPSVIIPTFTLGVLTGSGGVDIENDDLYQLSLYSSSNVLLGNSPLQVNNSPDNANPTTDDFFFATVSGAGTGDYLKLTAAQNPSNSPGTSNIVFGGVTFANASVPEPSTYALMFTGLGALVLMARLRRRDA